MNALAIAASLVALTAVPQPRTDGADVADDDVGDDMLASRTVPRGVTAFRRICAGDDGALFDEVGVFVAHKSIASVHRPISDVSTLDARDGYGEIDPGDGTRVDLPSTPQGIAQLAAKHRAALLGLLADAFAPNPLFFAGFSSPAPVFAKDGASIASSVDATGPPARLLRFVRADAMNDDGTERAFAPPKCDAK